MNSLHWLKVTIVLVSSGTSKRMSRCSDCGASLVLICLNFCMADSSYSGTASRMRSQLAWQLLTTWSPHSRFQFPLRWRGAKHKLTIAPWGQQRKCHTALAPTSCGSGGCANISWLSYSWNYGSGSECQRHTVHHHSWMWTPLFWACFKHCTAEAPDKCGSLSFYA